VAYPSELFWYLDLGNLVYFEGAASFILIIYTVKEKINISDSAAFQPMTYRLSLCIIYMGRRGRGKSSWGGRWWARPFIVQLQVTNFAVGGARAFHLGAFFQQVLNISES
jgi:hypothetical protein